MNHQCLSILAAIAASSTIIPTGSAQGTIVYHNEGDFRIFSDGGFRFEHDLDLDGNGTVDYKMVAQAGFWIEPSGSNEIAGRPVGGFDLGSHVWPLAAQDSLSSVVPAPLRWTGTETYVSPGGSTSLLYPYFHDRSTSGTSGPWQSGVDAYIGVNFLIDDQTHYGWINLEIPNTIPDVWLNGGIIHDWAYNTTPGEMILAGQVPEPSTWALLVGGGALLWWRCRR